MTPKPYWAVSIPDLSEYYAARLVEWASEEGIAEGCALDPATNWTAFEDRASAMRSANALLGLPPADSNEAHGRDAMAERLERWLAPASEAGNAPRGWHVDLPGLTRENAERITEWVGGLDDPERIDPRDLMAVCVDRQEAEAWLRALKGIPPASNEERDTRRQMLTVFESWLAHARADECRTPNACGLP